MSAHPTIFADTDSGPEIRIRVEGRGTFQNSPALREFSRRMMEQGRREFVVDLCACPAMDSTFMGTLAGLAMRLREAGGGDLWVINRGQRNADLLAGLGLDVLFSDRPHPEQCEGAAIQPVHYAADKAETRAAMDEAHKACVSVNPANTEKFKDVIELLRASAAKAGSS